MRYDREKNELVFSSGKRVYSFGDNPSINVGEPDVLEYCYGSDGGFSIKHGDNIYGEIDLDDAIELASAMLETWTQHLAYLESLKQLSGDKP